MSLLEKNVSVGMVCVEPRFSAVWVCLERMVPCLEFAWNQMCSVGMVCLEPRVLLSGFAQSEWYPVRVCLKPMFLLTWFVKDLLLYGLLISNGTLHWVCLNPNVSVGMVCVELRVFAVWIC